MRRDSLPFHVLPGRPTQAVILAGGRGTRMRPYTDDRPKPMVEIGGKPFLEYLVELLRDQGFDRVLMLLGYLPQMIQEYFGDGSSWGVQIDYSVSEADDLTGRRVQLARNKIDPCFLLMYCDNYWPMPFERMWKKFSDAKVPGMITVYSNRDKYSRDSVLVGEDSYVQVFDRSRTTAGLQGVEISYAILKKEVLNLLPDEDMLIEEALYPSLTKQRQLLAFVSDHRYYSVGSPERLPLTTNFFARRPTVILDRDGVLNKRPPKAEYVQTWEQFQWIPGAKEALRRFREAGYRIIVVSNQAGVARGALTEADLNRINDQMIAEANQAGGGIDAIYCCLHDWDEGCECRKPRPGMLFQAQREHDLDLTRTWFIGDDERDAQAADAACCPSRLVTEQVTLLEIANSLLSGSARHSRRST